MDKETIHRDSGTGTRRRQMEETGEQLNKSAPPTTPSSVKDERRRSKIYNLGLKFHLKITVFTPRERKKKRVSETKKYMKTVICTDECRATLDGYGS